MEGWYISYFCLFFDWIVVLEIHFFRSWPVWLCCIYFPTWVKGPAENIEVLIFLSLLPWNLAPETRKKHHFTVFKTKGKGILKWGTDWGVLFCYMTQVFLNFLEWFEFYQTPKFSQFFNCYICGRWTWFLKQNLCLYLCRPVL